MEISWFFAPMTESLSPVFPISAQADNDEKHEQNAGMTIVATVLGPLSVNHCPIETDPAGEHFKKYNAIMGYNTYSYRLLLSFCNECNP